MKTTDYEIFIKACKKRKLKCLMPSEENATLLEKVFYYIRDNFNYNNEKFRHFVSFNEYCEMVLSEMKKYTIKSYLKDFFSKDDFIYKILKFDIKTTSDFEELLNRKELYPYYSYLCSPIWYHKHFKINENEYLTHIYRA